MHLVGCYGHHKAATAWMRQILQAVCYQNAWNLAVVHNSDQFNHNLASFVAGRKVDFLSYLNARIEYVNQLGDAHAFHVVRDPRDIVVSAYFSHLYSHSTDQWPELVPQREKLRVASKNEGLQLEMEWRHEQFTEMYNWDYGRPNILEVRMEALTSDPHRMFLRIFDFLGILQEHTGQIEDLMRNLIGFANRIIWKAQRLGARLAVASFTSRPGGLRLSSLTRRQTESILDRFAFGRLSGGRPVGDEDQTHHYRRGVAGDWRNHFTSDHADFFRREYGDLLLKLGYEQNHAWTHTAPRPSKEHFTRRTGR